MIRTRYFTFKRRDTDPGPYHVLKVSIADKREVEITVSPTGRNVHIYLDGKQVTS